MTGGDSPSFSELIGLEFTDVGEGWARGELTVGDELTNPYGTLHGGVPYAMADTTMGAALQSELEPGAQCATIEIKMSYLEPVAEGTIACETSLVRRGRSIAFLESEITTDDGATDDESSKVVARATGSFTIFTP